MRNYIEEGREAIRDAEGIKAKSKEIFTTAIDLLKIKGKLGKTGIFSKGQIIEHTVNSVEPKVPVEIWSGKNLEKATQINIAIPGVGTLEVNKKMSQDKEEFKGVRWSPKGFKYSLKVDDVRGYLSALQQVKEELESPQVPQLEQNPKNK